MYLRIVRPLPAKLEGFDVSRFQLHGGYEIPDPLSEILVVAGYAVPIDAPSLSREAATKAVAGAVIRRAAAPRLTASADDRRARKRRTRGR